MLHLLKRARCTSASLDERARERTYIRVCTYQTSGCTRARLSRYTDERGGRLVARRRGGLIRRFLPVPREILATRIDSQRSKRHRLSTFPRRAVRAERRKDEALRDVEFSESPLLPPLATFLTRKTPFPCPDFFGPEHTAIVTSSCKTSAPLTPGRFVDSYLYERRSFSYGRQFTYR